MNASSLPASAYCGLGVGLNCANASRPDTNNMNPEELGREK